MIPAERGPAEAVDPTGGAGPARAVDRGGLKGQTAAVAAAVMVLALVLVPGIRGGYTLYMATEIAIFSLAATALNVLVGHLGLVSLGHAAFFGLGAYAAALLGKHGSAAGLLTLPAAAGAAVAFAAVTGPFVLRSHGIFFLMLTLAFAQMLHGAAQQWVDVTGGSDGVAGIPKLEFAGLGEPVPFYTFVLALLAGFLAALGRLLQAPFGRVLEAVRDGEAKARALGYPVFWYKFAALLLSAAITGLAGALHAHHTGFVSPGTLSWTTSGALLVMVLLGGRGTLGGGVLGAALYMVFETWLSSWTDYWHMGVGFMLMAVVLGSRRGLWGLLEGLLQRGAVRRGG